MKSALGSAYSSFSDDEKQLLTRCAARAVGVKIRKMAGLDVTADELQVESQLKAIKAIAEEVLIPTFWEMVGKIVTQAAGALLGQALKLIPLPI